MSERDTFCLRLRREREWRGISLDTIATVTKVGVDLWDGLEHNDFSRWPSGIFARAFIRDYARAVGLDADEVVDEFCRLFPLGDRRASRIIQAHAALVGHNPSATEDVKLLPAGTDRRAAARERQAESKARRLRFAPRTVAAVIDVGCTICLAGSGPFLFGAGFWASAGVMGILYYGISTVMLGATPGARAVDILRQRVPTLFTVQDRAHAA